MVEPVVILGPERPDGAGNTSNERMPGMRRFRYRALVTLSFVAVAASAISGQPVPGQAAGSPQTDTYTVFLQSRPVGQERVAVIEQADGWVIRGSSRLGQPLDVTTRTAEI